MDKPLTPLLDEVSSPADLKELSRDELRQLADELRAEVIDAVSVTGGHLGAGLGVIELTVALHTVFDTPNDRLIWDVGHQAYPHKVLTGRRDRIRTLRQRDGLSGFTRRAESAYDPFGAGHSSTSISAGLGMAVASDLRNEKRNVIAVIGDGAMSAGMAYEAMNNAGAMDARLIVILNDNDMSIAPPTGAMRSYLAKLVSGRFYRGVRDTAKSITEKMPRLIHETARKTEEFARSFFTGGTLFEELGFFYVGPIDGHNLNDLIDVLQNVRDTGQRPDAGACRHQEGQGVRAGRELRRQVSRRQQVQRHHRRAGEAAVQRPVLHLGVRAEPHRRGQGRRAHRRRHRRDAQRHRARQVRRAVPHPHASMSASPSSTR